MADPRGQHQIRPGRGYPILVGLAFLVVVGVATLNTINTRDNGVLGAGGGDPGAPLAEFAIPDARGELTGDANIAQDDCAVAARPCPASERRTPACRVQGPGVIRVCDLFDRALAISFWFTRGGDCERQQDVFERAYRRFRARVNFLAVNVHDDRARVRELIAERGWTHPVGLDADGALSNLYRVGGCPTIVFAYPGGIQREATIGQLDEAELSEHVRALIRDSRRRAAGSF